MATHILTTAELQASIGSFMQAVNTYNYYLMQVFFNFGSTGCRWKELYEVNRWTKIDSSTYTVQPAKSGNLRTFDITKLSPHLRALIENETEYDYDCRYNKMVKMFNKFYMYQDVYVGEKKVSLHLFRYSYCKDLKADGQTDEQIKTSLGAVDQQNADSYIYGEVKTDQWPD